MAKYDPLARILEELPLERLVVTLSFADVARLVGGLPPSAYRLRQWWANDSKVEARAWRSAGWHVDSDGVDFNGEKVRFARGKVGGNTRPWAGAGVGPTIPPVDGRAHGRLIRQPSESPLPSKRVHQFTLTLFQDGGRPFVVASGPGW